VKLGTHFGVVGKPIPDFLIRVHRTYFDILSGFLTNRLNIAKLAALVLKNVSICCSKTDVIVKFLKTISG